MIPIDFRVLFFLRRSSEKCLFFRICRKTLISSLRLTPRVRAFFLVLENLKSRFLESYEGFWVEFLHMLLL
jgi:hypothetical protein